MSMQQLQSTNNSSSTTTTGQQQQQQKQQLSKLEGNPVLNTNSSSADGNVIGGATKTSPSSASASSSQQNNRKSRNNGGGTKGDISQESDSFYKYYNKEIKVNQEEIPIVLYELVDAAYNYIQRESYEKALILLQKTEGVLEVVSLESSKRDRYIAYATFHNMAMCYQKLGMLEECFVYLKECLAILTAPLPKGQHFYKYSSDNCVAARMKQLKQECKLKLQLCAILSQTQNHTEALDNAKKSCKLIHQLFKDLQMLCALYIRKIEKKEINRRAAVQAQKEINAENNNQTDQEQHQVIPNSGTASINFLEESISMLERTSMKLYPIVKEVIKRMIDETPKPGQQEQINADDDDEIVKLISQDESLLLPNGGAPDMRSVLGFLNQNEWVHALNIGNIMQLQPISLKADMLSQCRNECELSRDAFLEKIALLGVAYFCVSTEMRFILQSREQYLSSPVKRQRELESEFWHAKSLEIACSFLPSECPLLNHILLSYQKHHDPSLQPIKEDQEQTDVLNVIRPLPGIESNKYQPIVRQINSIKVAITPCQISPITRRIFNNNRSQQNIPNHPIAAALPNINEDSTIVMYDQQEMKQFNNQQLQTSLEFNNDQLKQAQLQQSQSLYSDDYYDNFVQKMFDENPLLDKKQLVSKILSHLQSQDYSFLQRQINEQHQIDEFDMDESNILLLDEQIRKQREIEKEQRRTLMHFENNESDNDSQVVDIDDIMMVNKSFDIIQQLEGKKKQNYRSKLIVSGLGLEQLSENNLSQEKLEEGSIGGQSEENSLTKGILWTQQQQKGKKIVDYTGAPLSRGGPSGPSSGGTSSKYSKSNKDSKKSEQPSMIKGSINKLEGDTKKKREPVNRVQKLMSYLEGESLLKDIEKSLSHQRLIEGARSNEDLDIDDDHRLRPVHSHLMAEDDELNEDRDSLLDMNLHQKRAQTEIGHHQDDDESHGGGKRKQLIPLEIESDNDQEELLLQHGLKQILKASSNQNNDNTKSRIQQAQGKIKSKDNDKSSLKRVKQTSQIVNKNTNMKSNSSCTRPSSSITNYNSITGTAVSGIGRRTSHSFLMNKKGKTSGHGMRKNPILQQQFASQHASHLIDNSRSSSDTNSPPLSSSMSPTAQLFNSRQRAITTMSAERPKQSRVQEKNLQRILTNTAVEGQRGGKDRQFSNTAHKQNSKKLNSKAVQQPRSKSRLSNQSRGSQNNHHHFRSINNQLRKDNKLLGKEQGANQRKTAKSKSSENKGRSSSSKKSQVKKRDFSSGSQNPESITPIGSGDKEIMPLFTQPSFSEHSNNKNIFPHNHSFDMSLIKRTNKSKSRDTCTSISNLQQQVLQNQKLLMQFQQQQIISKARPSTAAHHGKGFPISMDNIQPITASLDNTKKCSSSKSRSKSINQKNGMLKLANYHQKSIDQSRQSLVSQFLPAGKNVSGSTQMNFDSIIRAPSMLSNKENVQILSKATQNRKNSGDGLVNSATKKKSIKEFAHELLARKMFFDKNSPQLLKKKKLTPGSHSPPKKQQQQTKSAQQLVQKLSQKATSNLKNLMTGINSRQATSSTNYTMGGGASAMSGNKFAFATTESSNTQGRNRAMTAKTGKKRNKHLHSSFMQLGQDVSNICDDSQQQHSQSQWLMGDNNQSFDAMIRQPAGSKVIMTTEGDSMGGSNIKRASSKSGSSLFDQQQVISRLNFGMMNKQQSIGDASLMNLAAHHQHFNSQQQVPTRHTQSINENNNRQPSSISAVAAAALLSQMRNNRNGNNAQGQSFQGSLSMFQSQQSQGQTHHRAAQAQLPTGILNQQQRPQSKVGNRVEQNRKTTQNIRA